MFPRPGAVGGDDPFGITDRADLPAGGEPPQAVKDAGEEQQDPEEALNHETAFGVRFSGGELAAAGGAVEAFLLADAVVFGLCRNDCAFGRVDHLAVVGVDLAAPGACSSLGVVLHAAFLALLIFHCGLLSPPVDLLFYHTPA